YDALRMVRVGARVSGRAEGPLASAECHRRSMRGGLGVRTDFSNKPNHRWPPEDGPSGMNGASIINSEAESMRVRRWLTKYGRSATQFKKTDFGDCVGEIEKGSFHWLVVPSLSVVASFEQLRRL